MCNCNYAILLSLIPDVQGVAGVGRSTGLFLL